MQQINWNRLLVILLCAIAVLVLLVALGYVLSLISHALLLFALAAVLALVLSPIVDWGEQRGLPRVLVVLVTYLAFAAFFVGGLALIISPLVSQVTQLSIALPRYVAELNNNLTAFEQSLLGTPFAGSIASVEQQVTGSIAGWSAVVVGNVVTLLSGVGAGVADGVLTLIISIYMLASGRHIHNNVRDLLPPGPRETFVFLTGSLAQVLGGYIRGQLTLALLLGVIVSIGLQLLGLPYALLLGLLAMVLGIIPMLGSALSAVPALFVALYQPFPTVLWVLIFFIVVQNVQDQIIAPRISGEAVGLHPLAVMFALLSGAQLAGGLGALFALPVAGFIWIVLVAVYRSLRRSGVIPGAAPEGVPRAAPPPAPEEVPPAQPAPSG